MNFPQNEKIKLTATILYRRSAFAPQHNVTGTIVATAQ